MTLTIYALATAAGRAAVAVVRISGSRTAEVVDALAGSRPPARQAGLRRIRDHAGVVLDEALVLWFEGPASFSGEDSAELHLHGGLAVVDAVTAALENAGVALAEPGEFTRRAFENGKLDLTQAEAVADLVDAETEGQRRQALAQLEGALGGRYRDWRDRLIQALALLEAEVDFPDEELPGGVGARSHPMLEDLRSELREALSTASRGERVREGYKIALIGAPNAGKSTLLNALARRQAAIVTATPGTTRDVIEIPLLLNGYAALLADTAGIRVTTNEIEAEGVRRARRWAEDAALRLLIVDGSADNTPSLHDLGGRRGDLVVLSKADRPEGGAAGVVRAWAAVAALDTVSTSSLEPDSLTALSRWLSDRVTADLTGSEHAAVTRARHRRLLGEAEAHLGRALEALEPELAAEDTRLAARALGTVIGAVGVEDVLGEVFAKFCIGK